MTKEVINKEKITKAIELVKEIKDDLEANFVKNINSKAIVNNIANNIIEDKFKLAVANNIAVINLKLDNITVLFIAPDIVLDKLSEAIENFSDYDIVFELLVAAMLKYKPSIIFNKAINTRIVKYFSLYSEKFYEIVELLKSLDLSQAKIEEVINAIEIDLYAGINLEEIAKSIKIKYNV